MSPFPERPDVAAVEVEAAAWIAQLNSDRWSNADQAALREWCQRSPAHREALRRLGATWADLDNLSSLRSNVDAAQRAVSATGFRNRFWITHAAMATAVVIALALWGGVYQLSVRQPAVQFYSTNIGEQKTIELPDRSTVQLNTSSLLEVSYLPDERRLRLVKGEALFEVEKDVRRPFLVNVAGNTVRAVGTRFSVRLGAEEIEVLVSEGTVAVSRSAADGGGPNLGDARAPVVRMKEIATIRDRAADPIRITGVDAHELGRRLSWAGGTLEFDGEPLERVVAEVSRYTPVKITIGDPKLRQVPVGGRFRVGETQALFDAIEATFGATVVYDRDGVTITSADVRSNPQP